MEENNNGTSQGFTQELFRQNMTIKLRNGNIIFYRILHSFFYRNQNHSNYCVYFLILFFCHFLINCFFLIKTVIPCSILLCYFGCYYCIFTLSIFLLLILHSSQDIIHDSRRSSQSKRTFRIKSRNTIESRNCQCPSSSSKFST